MKRFCFRLAIARPDVGFDYFGSWHSYNPAPILEDARRVLEHAPATGLRLQIDDGSGIRADLVWDPKWLLLLSMQHSSGMCQMDWNRMATNVLLKTTAL